MKIYWKNILWNHTVRYWHLLTYYINGRHKHRWKFFLYPHKLPLHKGQTDKFILEVSKIIAEKTLDDIKQKYEDMKK